MTTYYVVDDFLKAWDTLCRYKSNSGRDRQGNKKISRLSRMFEGSKCYGERKNRAGKGGSGVSVALEGQLQF